jgi:hypothetical protein
MPANEPTSGYAEATREACETLVETVATANERTLAYAIAANRAAADLALGGVRFIVALHASYLATLRGLAETSVSNLRFAGKAVERGRLQSQTLPMPSVN